MKNMFLTVLALVMVISLNSAVFAGGSSSENFAMPIAQTGKSLRDEVARLIPDQQRLQQKAEEYKAQWKKSNEQALLNGIRTAGVYFENGQGTKARRLLDDCKNYAAEAGITLPDSFAEFRNVAQMKEALEDHASYVTGNESAIGISYLSSAIEEMQNSIAFEKEKAIQIKRGR